MTGSTDGQAPGVGGEGETSVVDQRRADILSAAATLFDEVGYHNASMTSLAEASGTSKEEVYACFRAKHEILFALHEEWIDELLARSRERLDVGGDAADLIRQLADDVLTIIHERPSQVRVYFAYAAELPPELEARARAKRDAYRQLVEGVLMRGMAVGTFREQPSQIATLAFFGLCNWAFMWYDPRGPQSHLEIARQLSDIFLWGVETGQSFTSHEC